MRKATIGKKIFILIISLFVFIIAAFFFLNQSHENEYMISNINLRLQDYNDRMYEVLELQDSDRTVTDVSSVKRYIARHPLDGLRVTIIRPDGRVVFDSHHHDLTKIQNHRDRKEISDALKRGHGYDISRASNTVQGRFFYSATYYPADSIIIRTALPYQNDLSESLNRYRTFMAISFVVLLVLCVLLYRFIQRLSSNVAQLRVFAGKADRNEPLKLEDLAQFPNDELGEISEHIIKLYIRLQKTKNEQNVLKRQLTQNIAHELKTPIASIDGYLETILATPGMKPEMQRKFLERCYAQSQRLGSLVNDISTLNRLDDGISNMHFTEIDITEIVGNIINETALGLQEHHMQFDNQLPARLVYRGNSSLIYSIFRNLTDNAIAYAGNGTTITLTEETHDDGSLHFVFSDNGVGVSPQHLPRLFERFYRIDKGRSRKLGGTGLGLAIVKNAILVHGGSIKAENNPGGGLRFEFNLV